MRAHDTRLLAAMALGLCGDPAAAQEATGMKLEAAGFTMRPALTAKDLERVKKLPPHKFIARTKAGGRYFLYADPDYCKCVFAGDQFAMNNYRDMVAPPPQAPTMVDADGKSIENQMIQEMDEDVHGPIAEGDLFDFKF